MADTQDLAIELNEQVFRIGRGFEFAGHIAVEIAIS